MTTHFEVKAKNRGWRTAWAAGLTTIILAVAILGGGTVAKADTIPATFGSVTVTQSATDDTPVTEVANGQLVHLLAQFAIPDHPAEGSTFTLGLPSELTAVGGSVDLTDSSGQAIATATSVAGGDTVTFTTTPYAAGLTNITGAYTMDQHFLSDAADGTELGLNFDGNGTDFPWDVTVVGIPPIGWDVPAKSVAPWGTDQVNWAITLPGGPLTNVVLEDNLPIGVPLTSCDAVFVYSNEYAPEEQDADPISTTLLPRDSGRYTFDCNEATGFTLALTSIAANEKITMDFWSDIADPTVLSYTNTATVTIDGAATDFGATFKTVRQGGDAVGVGILRLIKTVVGTGTGPYTANVSCTLGAAVLPDFPKQVSVSPSAPVDILVASGAACSVIESEDGGATSHSITPNLGDDQTGVATIGEHDISEVTITNVFDAPPASPIVDVPTDGIVPPATASGPTTLATTGSHDGGVSIVFVISMILSGIALIGGTALRTRSRSA